MASKSGKKGKGSPSGGPAFAAMPGSAIAVGQASRPAPVIAASQHGRWFRPGEAVTVNGITLHSGMIYLGASLTSLDGSGVEPALINPNLRVVEPTGFLGIESTRFQPEYADLTPFARWRFLRWLASGRNDPDANPDWPFLFFFGIERRLIAGCVPGRYRAPSAEPPLHSEERFELQEELSRLHDQYRDPAYQASVVRLLVFGELMLFLANPDAMMGSLRPDRVATLPANSQDIPPLLAAVLAYLAFKKRPISAEWAWAWYCQDPETRAGEGYVYRDELRQVFLRLYRDSAAPDDRLLYPTNVPITAEYSPSSPGFRTKISPLNGASEANRVWLRKVDRGPLLAMRVIGQAAKDELNAFNSFGGWSPRHTGRSALAYALRWQFEDFAELPEAIKFREWLETHVTAAVDVPAVTPLAPLMARWQGNKTPTAMTATAAKALLEGMDLLGFAMEPDSRFGGPALVLGDDGKGVGYVVRRAPGVAIGEADDDEYIIAHRVGLPLIGRVMTAAGNTEPAALAEAAQALPGAPGFDDARMLARLSWLVNSPRSASRLPRAKDLTEAELTASARAQIADSLIAAVMLAIPMNPAAVTELVRCFKLLDLGEEEVYSRLHASAVGVRAPGGAKAGADRARPANHATTAESAKPSIRSDTSPVRGAVTIDQSLVQQKQAESAHVASLLANIFSEEGPAIVEPAPAAKTAADSPTGLDARLVSLLRTLLSRESWTAVDFAAAAKSERLLPNAAIDAVNEAAIELFGEPILEGDDEILVMTDLAKEMIGAAG